MLAVFDIETNGLLDEVTKVHCINVTDRATRAEYRFTDHAHYETLDGSEGKPTPRAGSLKDGLKLLGKAEELGGQNIIDYDLAVLKKLCGFEYNGRIRDTKMLSQLMYPDLKDRDFANMRRGKLPKDFAARGLIGTHKLESWGIRLGKNLKADFDPKTFGHTWATIPFIEEMDDYCAQDVRTNVDVLEFFLGKATPEEVLELETAVWQIIRRQELYGFKLDVAGAEKLVAELRIESVKLEEECRQTFRPWFARDGAEKEWKRDMRKWTPHEEGAETRKGQRGFYTHTFGGSVRQPIKLLDFNPGSRDHIADRLKALHGWTPAEFTPEGRAKVSEEILASLTYPEAKPIARYLTNEKRLGQLGEGKESWLKHVKADGRVHGRVNTMGAVTYRMTHFNPNVANADKWKPMRALWTVPEGKALVGMDAEGLELRMLAHFMARFDGGAYAVTVVEGRKEDGTDMHTVNQKVVGLNSRDNTKTWFYAFIYGAGDFKLGTIIVDDMADAQRDKFNAAFPPGRKREQAIAGLGKRSRARLMKGLPALGALSKAVKKAARRGWLKGLDGRRVHVRSEHAALNTLLQSGGALVMKRALVILDAELQSMKLRPGVDYEYVANVHDEIQTEADTKHAERVAAVAADSVRIAGEFYKLRCPLAGSSRVGKTWAETH